MTGEDSEIRKGDKGADVQQGKGLSLPSLRKIDEFRADGLSPERSADALKERTKSLGAEVHASMQDEESGPSQIESASVKKR